MRTFLSVVVLTGLALAQEPVRYPPKPGPREFILDQANLLQPAHAADIRKLCSEVLTSKQAPIVVVTIPSLAEMGASGWPIERYAMNLMAEWGIGWPEWNYGMLLLVSPGDRKARIELGGSWARRKDDAAQRVMSEQIIPYFKQGKMAEGILAGVRGLHAIAMELGPAPAATRPVPPPSNAPPDAAPAPGGFKLPGGSCGMWPLLVIGIVGLLVVSRMFRNRAQSWGSGGPGMFGNRGGGFGSGLGGGLLGGALGSMIGNAISRRGTSGGSSGGLFGGGSSGGGSFGGGSFGGGFSGGGGATGSW